MNAKTTGGEWRVTGRRERNGDRIVANDSEIVALACDFNDYARDAEVDANAALIASAPQLRAKLDEAIILLRLTNLACEGDVLNPCFDNRPSDVAGRHWGIGEACPACCRRAFLAEIDKATS